MGYTLPSMIKLLHKYDEDTLFKDEFFERRKSKAMGHEYLQLKPVARFEDGVRLGYNVGTRTNGMDKAKWPADLSVEVVS